MPTTASTSSARRGRSTASPATATATRPGPGQHLYDDLPEIRTLAANAGTSAEPAAEPPGLLDEDEDEAVTEGVLGR